MNKTSINKRISNLKKLQLELIKEINEDKRFLGIEVTDIDKVAIKPQKKEQPTNFELRDLKCDKQYFSNIKSLLEQIPESNGSRYYKQLAAKIGIIADEFLFNSYKGIANFIYLTPENYKQNKDLDVILVVSTWKGLNQEWKGLGNPLSEKRKQLVQLINFYKKEDIPVAFYSKEDPVNYEVYVDIAKHCDVIFTTAEEKIEDYKKECKNDHVHLLEFGINPLYHNPVGFRKFPKLQGAIFSGSWYEKYPERQIDCETIFDGIIESEHKLKIIDRNYNLNLQKYFFPAKYFESTSPAIEHEYLQKLHKLYDWAINLNSIKYSTTMFANRVYELQAIGNIILSNYSIGVNNKFPNVFTIQDQNEVGHILNGFTKEEIYAHQIYGIRRVMSTETTFERIQQFLHIVGVHSENISRSILVVANERNERVMRMFETQSYSNKTLILESDFTEEIKKEYDVVAFFHCDYQYDEYYLEDMINGFKYTNSSYITKDAYVNGEMVITGTEHDYVQLMKDKYKTVFWGDIFSANELIDMTKATSIPNGYSIDHFELNVCMDSNPSSKIAGELKYSVIIPIYNNATHLLNKCFNSLKRSSTFNQMEIIMVDDGSTDEKTVMTVKRLERKYENVKAYYFNDGGSGSASRPRNKGFELSTTPYITYLDPDNEAVNDGYTKLYEELIGTNYDMVVGTMPRYAETIKKMSFYHLVHQLINSDTIEGDTKEFLVRSKFRAFSIQALMVKREIIANNKLEMVVGGLGQDSMFFQELLINSQRVKAIDEDIHIYYAAVNGSVVNTISKNFYQKYLILERGRVEYLAKHDLLELYAEGKLAQYFKHWYLAKFKNISLKDRTEIIDILSSILDLYKVKLNEGNSELVKCYEMLEVVKGENFS